MMCGIDIIDAHTVDAFVKHVLEQLLLLRMTSAPDTSLMLITMTGFLDADAFARIFRAHLAENVVMQTFMVEMTKADVIQCTPEGRVIGSASLI